jgi:rhodanese-related sulfurtransferase
MAKTVDELLSEARALLPYRPSPAEALTAQANGALLVDIRGDDQRRAGGLIPGAVVLARNVLEWRCDPASPWRDAAIRTWDQVIIVVCQEGFQSSLAAAALQRLGLRNATDLDGGSPPGGRLACRWSPRTCCSRAQRAPPREHTLQTRAERCRGRPGTAPDRPPRRVRHRLPARCRSGSVARARAGS